MTAKRNKGKNSLKSELPHQIRGGYRSFCKWWNKLSIFKKILILYTLAFCIIILIGFAGYIFSGNTFIHTADAWDQHYRALVYIGQYLREITRNILGGNFSIPTWDFTIGQGSDIITTLSYYGLGDPLSLLAIFVPTKYTWILYGFLIVLKMYLSGLAFIAMCLYFKKKNVYAILSGAIAYVFCAWTAVTCTYHTMFIVPMIYLPLIVIGVEKILAGKSGLLLSLSVFLLGISNIYFFALTAIVVCIYSLLRISFIYKKDFGAYIKPFLRLALYSIFGFVMAAILLVSVANALLQSGRSNRGTSASLLWPTSYYSNSFAAFISMNGPDNSLRVGMTPIVMLAIFLLFKNRKQHPFMFLAITLMLIALLSPLVSKIINGFLYADNRWSFALSLAMAYTLVLMWPKLLKLTSSDGKYLLICISTYTALCFIFTQSNIKEAFQSLTMMLIIFAILALHSSRRKSIFPSGLLATLVVVSTLIFVWDANGHLGKGYAYSTRRIDEVEDIKNNELKASLQVAKTLDKDYKLYRHSGRIKTTNAGLIQGASTISRYWSIASPCQMEYTDMLGTLDNTHSFNTLNDRPRLMSLSSVRYYTTSGDDNDYIPYGFEYVKTVNVGKSSYERALDRVISQTGQEATEKQKNYLKKKTDKSYKVYINKYALPLGYTYEKVLPEDYLDSLNMVQRESAIMQALIIDDNNEDIEFNLSEEIQEETQSLEYELSYGRDDGSITKSGNSFIVTDANSQIKLSIPEHDNGDIYVLFNNINYVETAEKDLYFGNEDVDPYNIYNLADWEMLGINSRYSINKNSFLQTQATSIAISSRLSSSNYSRSVTYRTPSNNWYGNRHDFALPLGPTDGSKDTITITFPKPGVYSFDSLDVVVQSMDNYEEQIDALREDVLENIEMTDNRITGSLSLDETKWLALSIPYSEGWKLYVDGEETKLYRANIQYMAAKIGPGKHEIELRYSTPLFKLGAILSSIACVIFIGMLIGHVYTGKRLRRLHEVHAESSNG